MNEPCWRGRRHGCAAVAFRIQTTDHMLAGAEWDRPPPEPEGPFGRYMALVTAVDSGPPERFPYEWLAAALRASAPPAR